MADTSRMSREVHVRICEGLAVEFHRPTRHLEIPQHYRLSRAEYGVGDYQRVFTLTDEVDRDKILATVRDGFFKANSA